MAVSLREVLEYSGLSTSLAEQIFCPSKSGVDTLSFSVVERLLLYFHCSLYRPPTEDFISFVSDDRKSPTSPRSSDPEMSLFFGFTPQTVEPTYRLQPKLFFFCCYKTRSLVPPPSL